MKKYILYLIITGAFIIAVVSSCKKEKAYNWQNIEAGIQRITGPDSVKGNDSTSYQYLAIPRGGSKYIWRILRGPITISQDTINKDPLHYHPYRIEVTANSKSDTSAAIAVREITWAGDSGIIDTFVIKKVACYKAFDTALFVGKYKCYETNLTDGTSLVPYIANFSYVGGDIFIIDDFHLNGWNQMYAISKDKNEIITMLVNNPPYVYNGELVIANGKGYYSLCNGTITVNYFLINYNTGDTIESGTDRFVHQ